MKKVFLSVLMILTVLAVQACDEDGVSGMGTVEAILDIHQTGQATSHAPGDDGDHQSGVIPPEPRFTDNGNGTITDNLTRFLWTKDAGCLEDTTWEETLETASTIGDGDCGLTDGSEPGSWRVANARELHSLVDYGNSPTLPTDHPFMGIDEETVLWTSNTHATDAERAYVIVFRNAEVKLQSKNNTAGCMLLSLDCLQDTCGPAPCYCCINAC